MKSKCAHNTGKKKHDYEKAAFVGEATADSHAYQYENDDKNAISNNVSPSQCYFFEPWRRGEYLRISVSWKVV